MIDKVVDIFDWPYTPDVFVSQSPFLNAGTYGAEEPFIVLNSGMMELLNDEERRDILGHELGHIMSGHTTYTTIAIIILTLGLNNLPFLAGIALLPFQLALMEWYRKAEFSADRAGLLTTQDIRVTASTFMKMAGGKELDDTLSVDAFLEQASHYEGQNEFADKVWQVINTAFRTHPFGTVRAAELQRWVASGEYDKILRGDYRRRSDATTPPFSSDIEDAVGYYGEQARGAMDSLNGVFDRARCLQQRIQRDPLGREDSPGSGGRSTPSHGSSQDDPSLDLVAAPGNPGIASLGRCIPVSPTDAAAVVALANAEHPDLVVVGPEAPLAAGVSDALRDAGFRVFGPSKAAAELEASKRFAKEVMFAAGVPTAGASWHTDAPSAKLAVRMRGAPVVIKACGLAAGKGVVVALTLDEAELAVDRMFLGAFGEAGAEVLVEEFMAGESCRSSR
jgi:hypothetical protein